MGIAAYNRGSASIARGIRQEAGTWQEPLTPKPRPATWGSATAERALTRARSILASNRRLGRELDAEILAGAVQLRERCSDATALAAALQAMGESVAKPNGAPQLTRAWATSLGAQYGAEAARQVLQRPRDRRLAGDEGTMAQALLRDATAHAAELLRASHDGAAVQDAMDEDRDGAALEHAFLRGAASTALPVIAARLGGAKANGRRRAPEPMGPSLFDAPPRAPIAPTAPSAGEERLQTTLHEARAHQPHRVYGLLRDRQGHPLGVIDGPHQGTVASIREATEALQNRASREGWDWSGIQSQWIATGPDGRAGWAISPNLFHIDPVGSDAAAYTLGDLSRAPSRAQPPAPAPAPARAAAPIGATWPDGRLKPRGGDTVWRTVPGLYGAGIVRGTVTAYGRIRAQGKSYPVTVAWNVEGDPEIRRREEAAAEAAATAKATKAEIIAAATRAVDVMGLRMGFQRLGSAHELAPGDAVYSLRSEGAYGDGDPATIHTKAVRVSAVHDDGTFSYEDEHGAYITSGTVRNWWRPSGPPRPTRAKRSTRKAKANPAQASRVYSAGTSNRHVPGLHAALLATGTLLPGTLNVDVGGGKYDDATEALRSAGVRSVVYDPGHRANAPAVLKAVEDGQADSATIANVLNVIPDAGVRRQVLELADNVVRKGGAIYIDCYAGAGRAAGTGRGRKTSKGWQAYRPLASYLGEVRAVLPSARIVTFGHRPLIVARK